MVSGNHTLLFYYDESGSPTSFSHNGTMYFYIKNLQGDICKLVNTSGSVIVNYTYDAWGKLLSVKDANGDNISSSTHIALLNPLRYRGYVYDEETGLYYLQSRYYDPTIGRFINADILFDTESGSPLSTNMFAYCENDFIIFYDSTGYASKSTSYKPIKHAPNYIIEAIKRSGLYKKKNCIFPSNLYYNHFQSLSFYDLYTFTGPYHNYKYFSSVYYVYKDTFKGWLNFIKKNYDIPTLVLKEIEAWSELFTYSENPYHYVPAKLINLGIKFVFPSTPKKILNQICSKTYNKNNKMFYVCMRVKTSFYMLKYIKKYKKRMPKYQLSYIYYL